MEAKKYQDGLIFCNQLLNHCTDSMKFIGLKVQIYINQNKIADAIEYTTKLQTQYIDNPEFLFWRGKLLIYNANMEKGKQYLREAINKDPDNVNFQRAWKNLQKQEKVKKEATDAFASANYKEAIERFGECLELDPMNNSYNSAILFNRATAFQKLAQNQEAIGDLNRAIELNEDYAKAYNKRGDIQLSMAEYEEAARDYERAKTLDPTISGIKQKI